MSEPPSSAVLQRNLRHAYPCAVAASGHYIVDSEQRRYFDASGGAAISCLGHGDSEVVKALCEQAGRLDFAHTAFFTNDRGRGACALSLFSCARRSFLRLFLLRRLGGDGGFFQDCASVLAGTRRRNDAALDHHASSELSRQHFGNALSLGSNPQRRLPYAAMLLEQAVVSACDLYRGLKAGRERGKPMPTVWLCRVGTKDQRALGSRRALIAFAAETVSGSTLGAMPPAQGYWRKMREVCDRHGILLILDEVMCGSGRTGYRFACEEDG